LARASIPAQDNVPTRSRGFDATLDSQCFHSTPDSSDSGFLQAQAAQSDELSATSSSFIDDCCPNTPGFGLAPHGSDEDNTALEQAHHIEEDSLSAEARVEAIEDPHVQFFIRPPSHSEESTTESAMVLGNWPEDSLPIDILYESARINVADGLNRPPEPEQADSCVCVLEKVVDGLEGLVDDPVLTRRWTLFSECEWPSSDCYEIEVAICRPCLESECPITLGSITTSELDFLPGIQFFEDEPALRQVLVI
jgi:hypothetical protein